MASIKPNSRVQIRVTTAPGDLGYSGRATGWRDAPADRVTSPRLALDYLARLRKNLGGADYAVDLRCAGQSVTVDDLSAAASAAEAKRAGW